MALEDNWRAEVDLADPAGLGDEPELWSMDLGDGPPAEPAAGPPTAQAPRAGDLAQRTPPAPREAAAGPPIVARTSHVPIVAHNASQEAATRAHAAVVARGERAASRDVAVEALDWLKALSQAA